MSTQSDKNSEKLDVKILTDLDMPIQDCDMLIDDYNEEIDKLEYEITRLIIELFIMEKRIQRLTSEKEYIMLLKSGSEWYSPLSE